MRFVPQDYTDPPTVKEAVLTWQEIPLQNTVKNLYLNQMKIEREDNLLIELNEVTTSEDSLFYIEEDSQ